MLTKCHFGPSLEMPAPEGTPYNGGGWLATREYAGQGSRLIIPLCERCHTALNNAGVKGLKVKATGERWYPASWRHQD